MDRYKLKFTRLQNEIFRLLCIKAGRSLNQRGIARPLQVSPTAVAKSLPELNDLIKIEKSETMNLASIELNRDKPKAIAFKRVENLKQIYESGLAELLEEEFPGCTIILFGSYSLGEDIISSDIDIAVIGLKEKDINLTKFDKLMERTIILHFYHNLKINKNLKQNIINGITLHGIVEL